MFNIKPKPLHSLISLNMNLTTAEQWADNTPDYSADESDPLSPGANLRLMTVVTEVVCWDWDDNLLGAQRIQFIPRADGCAMHIYSFDKKGKHQNTKSKTYKNYQQAKQVYLRGYSDFVNWDDGAMTMSLINSVELANFQNKAIQKNLKLTREDKTPVKVKQIYIDY